MAALECDTAVRRILLIWARRGPLRSSGHDHTELLTGARRTATVGPGWVMRTKGWDSDSREHLHDQSDRCHICRGCVSNRDPD